MLCYLLLRVLTPFCGPFQSFRCPETSTSDWLFVSTLLCFPALQSLPEASEPWRWGSQRICCEFHRQSNQGHARGVVLYGSALRKRWSVHQHDTQKTMALFIKPCLCENAALLHLWHKNTNKIQFAIKCQSTTSCNYRNRHRFSLSIPSTSWLFMTFLNGFSQSLILQSSLKYLTSTNCCGSGSPWAMKQMV